MILNFKLKWRWLGKFLQTVKYAKSTEAFPASPRRREMALHLHFPFYDVQVGNFFGRVKSLSLSQYCFSCGRDLLHRDHLSPLLGWSWHQFRGEPPSLLLYHNRGSLWICQFEDLTIVIRFETSVCSSRDRSVAQQQWLRGTSPMPFRSNHLVTVVNRDPHSHI